MPRLVPGRRLARTTLAILWAVAAPATASPDLEVAPAPVGDLDRVEATPTVVATPDPAETTEAAPTGTPDIDPRVAMGPDEQTGYYYAFAFAATLGELFGGCALGLSIGSLVDGYDRDGLERQATTPDDAAAITSSAEDLRTLGWVTLGVGSLVLGLGLSLDVFLGSEFGDDDWWLRVGVTTPLAVAGAALLTGGLSQLDRAGALREVSPRLATLDARDALRGDIADAEMNGWILIGVGAAAIVGAATVWIKDAFEADDAGETTDAEEAGPAVALFPLTLPGGGGVGLSFVL